MITQAFTCYEKPARGPTSGLRAAYERPTSGLGAAYERPTSGLRGVYKGPTRRLQDAYETATCWLDAPLSIDDKTHLTYLKRAKLAFCLPSGCILRSICAENAHYGHSAAILCSDVTDFRS